MNNYDAPHRGPIVVGVSGPGGDSAALRFAAACAEREGTEVLLAHAFRTVHPIAPPGALVPYPELADVAERLVKEAAAEFESMTGGTIPFRTVTSAGTPARLLSDLSRDARMVVVQHRRDHRLARVLVGSTAYGTAAHAECPVVSVDPEWQMEDSQREVVIGVHERGGPSEVLEAGFAWAEAVGAPLRIVHAWRLDGAYDNIIAGRVADDWRGQQKQLLTDATAPLRQRHPSVDVTLEVRHEWPADVLAAASEGASLVVVGRHAGHPWTLEHLGSLARTLLRVCKSPVMVVPVEVSRPADGWDLSADELSPQT